MPDRPVAITPAGDMGALVAGGRTGLGETVSARTYRSGVEAGQCRWIQNGFVAVIVTTLRRVPDATFDRVDFVVRTDEPIYQNRLVKMGWHPTATSGEFARRLDAAPDVDEIFDRFSCHIEAMVRQSAGLEPIDWERGLCEVVDRARGTGLRWWLYGSAALAVRGAAVTPGDVDVHVDDRSSRGGSWRTCSWSR